MRVLLAREPAMERVLAALSSGTYVLAFPGQGLTILSALRNVSLLLFDAGGRDLRPLVR
jgi:hypothetical protein